MGIERGLNDILNDVSKRLEAVAPAPITTSSEVISELEAFMFCDDLLASLHKEFVDAKEQRIKATHEFGVDDGMTDMAVMMEDSCWCAMQTRYIELRGDRGLMKRAQEMIEEDRCKKEEKKKAEAEKEWLQKYQWMQLVSRQRQAEQDHANAIWLLLLWYGMDCHGLYQPMFRPQTMHCFNRLAA